MKNKRLVGIDIGSSKIAGVVAEISDDGSLVILTHASLPSGGISRGEFTDLNEASDLISHLFSRLKSKVANRLDEIYVNISGETIRGEKAKGMIPLSLRGREITRWDMARCANVASTIRLPIDREILHKVVHSFSIDDQPWIKNPIGLYASRLACEVCVITANISRIQNIYKCVNEAGYDVKEVVFTGMADGAAVLDEGEKNDGVVLVDMGASITEISLYFGGALRDIDIVLLGTEDLKGNFSDNAVFDDIASRVKLKTEEFLRRDGRIGHFVLTGGATFNDAIVEVIGKRLPYPLKIGIAKKIKGNISAADSMKLTTAIGLVKYGHDKQKKKSVEEKGIINRLSDRIVDVLNNYF